MDIKYENRRQDERYYHVYLFLNKQAHIFISYRFLYFY